MSNGLNKQRRLKRESRLKKAIDMHALARKDSESIQQKSKWTRNCGSIFIVSGGGENDKSSGTPNRMTAIKEAFSI